MRFDDDETLLGELRRVMGDADPVPDHVVAAAELALDWRTIDDELAELLDARKPTSESGKSKPEKSISPACGAKCAPP